MKYLMLLMSVILVSAASCNDDKDEPDQTDDPVEATRATLIYAVNNSSLATDFRKDSVEMDLGIEASEAGAVLMVYKTESKSSAGLYEVRKQGEKAVWRRIKGYDREVTSTSPERLRTVIDDFLERYPDAPHTLMFWGHGSAWEPGSEDHDPGYRGVAPEPGPEMYGYGGEYGRGGLKWMDVQNLADAIPEGKFDLIWFDCCYMGSVEMAYELRDKCTTYVAYPTEIWDRGANYDEILPLICRKKPDVTGAAEALFDYYDKSDLAVSVTVMQMEGIEAVADAVENLIAGNGDMRISAGVSNYGRGYSFYDMLQLVEKNTATKDMSALRSAFSKFVVYSRTSSCDFNGSAWIAEPLCGLSMYNLNTAVSSETNRYYLTLDWSKRILGE